LHAAGSPADAVVGQSPPDAKTISPECAAGTARRWNDDQLCQVGLDLAVAQIGADQ